MSPARDKIYLVDTFDPKMFLDSFFGPRVGKNLPDNTIKLTLDTFDYFFKFAPVKGDILIDLSLGPIIPHLFSAAGRFKEINLLRFNDSDITEITKSLQEQPGAFDWQYARTFISKKEGNQGKSEQKTLSTVVNHVLKCSTDTKNITDPIQLPPADCLILNLALDAVSKDQDDYIKKFRQFTQLLKPGGILLMNGLLNATFFIVGGEKFHLLEYNEDFVRNVLKGEGYVINHYDVHVGKEESDLSDCNGIIFVVAQKKA